MRPARERTTHFTENDTQHVRIVPPSGDIKRVSRTRWRHLRTPPTPSAGMGRLMPLLKRAYGPQTARTRKIYTFRTPEMHRTHALTFVQDSSPNPEAGAATTNDVWTPMNAYVRACWRACWRTCVLACGFFGRFAIGCTVTTNQPTPAMASGMIRRAHLRNVDADFVCVCVCVDSSGDNGLLRYPLGDFDSVNLSHSPLEFLSINLIEAPSHTPESFPLFLCFMQCAK